MRYFVSYMSYLSYLKYLMSYLTYNILEFQQKSIEYISVLHLALCAL